MITAHAEPTATPPPEPEGFTPETVPPVDANGRRQRVPDGLYLGGFDVAVGAYQSLGLRPGWQGLCSWSIDSEFDPSRGTSSGKPGLTVASGVTAEVGKPVRLVLEKGQELSTGGCQDWVRYAALDPTVVPTP